VKCRDDELHNYNDLHRSTMCLGRSHYFLLPSLHCLHRYLCRWCGQTPEPPHSLHLLFCLPCLHLADPPHCLHQCFCLSCWHMLPPPQSTHIPFLLSCSQRYLLFVDLVIGVAAFSEPRAPNESSGPGIKVVVVCFFSFWTQKLFMHISRSSACLNVKQSTVAFAVKLAANNCGVRDLSGCILILRPGPNGCASDSLKPTKQQGCSGFGFIDKTYPKTFLIDSFQTIFFVHDERCKVLQWFGTTVGVPRSCVAVGAANADGYGASGRGGGFER